MGLIIRAVNPKTDIKPRKTISGFLRDGLLESLPRIGWMKTPNMGLKTKTKLATLFETASAGERRYGMTSGMKDGAEKTLDGL